MFTKTAKEVKSSIYKDLPVANCELENYLIT